MESPKLHPAAILGLTMLAGCASRSPSAPYQTLSQQRFRNAVQAQQKNDDGLRLVESGALDQAEAAFRASLESDLFYAPAHNNLGRILLSQGKSYEAAWEFQWAAKLMPHSPEPLNNLGLVFEHVGRLEDAEKWLTAALDIEPQNIEVMGHLARVYVKANRKDAKLKELLTELAHRGENGWDLWARERLLSLDSL